MDRKTIKKVKGRSGAATPGRPRGLNDPMQRAIQQLYIGLMSPRFMAEMKANVPCYRSNSKRVISLLARVAKVSERVVSDVVKRRGAYSRGGYTKEEIDLMRALWRLSDEQYRALCAVYGDR